jgi:hypothetical protein
MSDTIHNIDDGSIEGSESRLLSIENEHLSSYAASIVKSLQNKGQIMKSLTDQNNTIKSKVRSEDARIMVLRQKLGLIVETKSFDNGSTHGF